MTSPRFFFALLALLMLQSGNAEAKCNPMTDPNCKTDGPASQATTVKKTGDVRGDRGSKSSVVKTPADIKGGRIQVVPGYPGHTSIAKAEAARPLQPVRAYLRAADIPPPSVGAYGLVVFHSRPTSASRQKLLMVCKSFVAHFPRSERSSVPASDQMMTIWPIETPDAQETQRDDWDFAIDNYDFVAAEAAITDATLQHGDFSGDGPFLVGWSPSKARVLPDALVLVIDMSRDSTQDEIDHQFLFWKNEIVQDPSKWRGGWSMERIRVALRGFADQYGPAIMDSVRFFTGKSQ